MKRALFFLIFSHWLVHALVAQEIKQMVISIDDLPANSLHHDIQTWQNINKGILKALDVHDVPAIGFVNESKLYLDGELVPQKVDLLRQWLKLGHELGNHGFAHLDLHKVPLADYLEDIEKGDQILTLLWRDAEGTRKYFRHPFLHTGTSHDIRKAINARLREQSYRIAPVTIDNQEYVFARVYERADSQKKKIAIANSYLEYMTSMILYYEQQSVALLGYQLPQVLLIHANQLNADYLEQLLEKSRDLGYAFVTLEQALRDPAYQLGDDYFGNGGITWIHRWAITQGKKGSFFGKEPTIPEFVRQAY